MTVRDLLDDATEASEESLSGKAIWGERNGHSRFSFMKSFEKPAFAHSPLLGNTIDLAQRVRELNHKIADMRREQLYLRVRNRVQHYSIVFSL